MSYSWGKSIAPNLTPLTVAGFGAMKALSTRNDEPEKASRPFDMNRDGFVVGEGAGILILEELELAKKRGATILAEIVGYGMSADAFHMTAPAEDGDGAMRVMRRAMADAGVEVGECLDLPVLARQPRQPAPGAHPSPEEWENFRSAIQVDQRPDCLWIQYTLSV